MTLLELAERCEKTTGPDRELDGTIDRLLNERPNEHDYDQGEDCIWHVDSFSGLCTRSDGFARKSFCARSYTASLDAAMTLVPEGHFVTVMNARDGKDRPELGYGLSIVCDANSVRSDEPSQAATMPLALCAAALRAGGETL